MARGPLLISVAILAAAYWIASLFRYEYFPNGLLRTDRWTGEREVKCGSTGVGWASLKDCQAAVLRQRATEIQPEDVQLDK
jgi:hypothetical protein